MARNDVPVTFVGNISSDISVNTVNGRTVANFNMAATPQRFDRNTNEFVDETPLYIRVSVWGRAALNLDASLKKGSGVVAVGKLKGNEFQINGENRYSLQMTAETVAADLQFATVEVTKNPKGNGGNSNSAPANSNQQDTDGWGDDSGSDDDAPF